jgi:hypothetical protein
MAKVRAIVRMTVTRQDVLVSLRARQRAAALAAGGLAAWSPRAVTFTNRKAQRSKLACKPRQWAHEE